MAPVVRRRDGGRELSMMRWGFPPPPKVGTQPVTNVRNVASPYWRPWLKPEFRCLVPVSAFREYADTKPKKSPVWFALDDERPLFAFAGIWRPLNGCARAEARRAGRGPINTGFVYSCLNKIARIARIARIAWKLMVTGESYKAAPAVARAV